MPLYSLHRQCQASVERWRTADTLVRDFFRVRPAEPIEIASRSPYPFGTGYLETMSIDHTIIRMYTRKQSYVEPELE
jgi:hypothetical protein